LLLRDAQWDLGAEPLMGAPRSWMLFVVWEITFYIKCGHANSLWYRRNLSGHEPFACRPSYSWANCGPFHVARAGRADRFISASGTMPNARGHFYVLVDVSPITCGPIDNARGQILFLTGNPADLSLLRAEDFVYHTPISASRMLTFVVHADHFPAMCDLLLERWPFSFLRTQELVWSFAL